MKREVLTGDELTNKANKKYESISANDVLVAAYTDGYRDCEKDIAIPNHDHIEIRTDEDMSYMREDELYKKIETEIINWNNDGHQTAGTLTRKLISIINGDDPSVKTT